MSLLVCLRIAGGSHVLLALLHTVLWRALGWHREIRTLSTLTARVFAVHTFFIALVLFGMGLLSLLHPELLVAPSPLARLLLLGIVIFWLARLALQCIVFDTAMREGWTRHVAVRVGAMTVWASYVAIYGFAFAQQLGIGSP